MDTKAPATVIHSLFEILSLKKKAVVSQVQLLKDCGIVNQSRYRSRNIPSAGAPLKEEDAQEKQISFEV